VIACQWPFLWMSEQITPKNWSMSSWVWPTIKKFMLQDSKRYFETKYLSRATLQPAQDYEDTRV
jgi:hypothetical protein